MPKRREPGEWYVSRDDWGDWFARCHKSPEDRSVEEYQCDYRWMAAAIVEAGNARRKARKR